MIKNEKKYIAYAFVINLILGAMLVRTGFILGKGTFYLGKDYNYQQVLFNMLAKTSILEGNVFWLDNFDLGTSFIGALAFYGIGSPFFWVTMLISGINYGIMLPIMIAFKLAVSGTSAYCYIKQYVKMPQWALVGSLIYAFSGYQIYNINFHFRDAIALFPFLLLALDKNVLEGKKGWFAFMVAVIALTNFFFFAQIVVFLVIYFAVKLISREYTLNTKLFLSLARESLLGVGMAMILLFPSLLQMMGNPRLSESIFSAETIRIFFHKPYRYADLLRAMLFPAENLFNRSIILRSNTTAAELYLPVVGMIPVFSYMSANKKDWMTKISAVCFVIMLSPVLNSSFTAFNAEYYSRWHFMLILIFAVMTAKHFEENGSIKAGLKMWFLLFALFYTARLRWHFHFHSEFFPNRLIAFIIIGMGVCGLLVTVFVSVIKNKKAAMYILVAAIFVQTTACFAIYTEYTHRYWNESFGPAKELFYSVPQIQYPDADTYYRTDTKSVHINTGLVSDKPSINIFATNTSGSTFEFYYANDMERTVNSFLDRDMYGFYSLLGVKYVMHPEGQQPDKEIKGFTDKPVWTDSGYDFYENTNYIGMGFAYKNAISADEYSLLNAKQKHIAAMDAIVLDDDSMEKYGDMFHIKNAENYKKVQYHDFEQYASDKKATVAENFTEHNGIYSFSVNLDRPTVYYVSVPYETGFTAEVNGEETEVIKVNNGLVGILLPAGENNVQLIYYPPGLNAGIAVSGICTVMFLVYIIIGRRSNYGQNYSKKQF